MDCYLGDVTDQARESWSWMSIPLSTPTWPAPSNALFASVGRAVSTTDAAMVSGKSASSFSSGIALFRPVGVCKLSDHSSRFGERLGDGEAMY